MPVFKSGIGPAPKWCEMETSDIIVLRRGGSHMQELLASAQESLAVQTRDVMCGLINVEQR